MNNEEIKQHIIAVQPNIVFDETGEWLQVQVEAGEWKGFAQWLRSDALYGFFVLSHLYRLVGHSQTLFLMKPANGCRYR